MIYCKKCKSENSENEKLCANCGVSLIIAVLECINGDENIELGTRWELFGRDYQLGRSVNCDIIIKGTCISRIHCNFKYCQEENRFYLESLAKNTFDFEKKSYKILDGAIIPFPETIELKLNYL